MRTRHHRCDGMTRRDMIRIGGLTAFGLFGMPHLNARGAEVKAKSCVLIWLDGGPSHLETFDPKPDAPAEVRGPLDVIKTRLPGVVISECLPKTAEMLDRFAIVRSVTSPLGEHNFGTHYLLTGHMPTPVLEYPSFGAVLADQRTGTRTLPANIAVPHFRVGGSRFSGGGFLPSATHPFSVGSDPAKPDFAVQDLDIPTDLDGARLDRRQNYVRELERLSRTLDATPPETDSDLDRALRLITSPTAKQAFNLDEEPASVRQRYGARSIGQSCLLARRLIEHGVPFVTVNNVGWDTHTEMFMRLKEGYTGAKVPVGLIPSLDIALTALVSDLADRGLLDETLVVVMGEFGRTPKLNTSAGRDHWPRVFSVLMAGGGVPGGQVIGSSDATAESPHDRPVTPSDLATTVYTLLGIDPELEMKTPDGRPVRLVPDQARAVRELIG